MTKSRHGDDCPCVECEHEYLFNLENKRYHMKKQSKVLLTINETIEFIFDNLQDAQDAQSALNKSVYINGYYVKGQGFADFQDGIPITSITTKYDPEAMKIYPDEEAAQSHVDSLKKDDT